MIVSGFLVLFPVGTGVMLNIVTCITCSPKSITVWFQILFCFQWIPEFFFKMLKTGK